MRNLCALRIDGSVSLEAPAWPPGVEVRSVRPGVDDGALWRADVFEHAGYEPSFYVAAWAADDVAGQALAVAGETAGAATLQDVSVRKPWRGRGVGRALLLELLGRLRAHGRDDVTVWVDAENETGAMHLYEVAGMRVWRRLGVYESASARCDGRRDRQAWWPERACTEHAGKAGDGVVCFLCLDQCEAHRD